jgi:hypothetical protein
MYINSPLGVIGNDYKSEMGEILRSYFKALGTRRSRIKTEAKKNSGN